MSRPSERGFTLIEVLVALVVVAFGMGAVLAALSGAARNLGALRDHTQAQWLAQNLIVDARLAQQAPQPQITEGDVTGFTGSDWHWQQQIEAVPTINGLMRITVRVRRTGAAKDPTHYAVSSGSGGSIGPSGSLGGGANIGSLPGTSSGLGLGSGAFASSGTFGTSSSSSSSSTSSTSSGAGAASGSSGASGDNQSWDAVAIGFRGDAIAQPANTVDWSGLSGAGGAPTSSSSGSSSGSTSGSSSSGSLFGSSSGLQGGRTNSARAGGA